MKKHSRTATSKSSEWFDATLIDVKPTRLSGLIFGLLCAILILSTIAYGAVDTWALAILSIGAGLIAILWLTDSFLSKEFRFTTNPLQLPIIGVILIGLIQLLPLRNLGISNDLLPIP